MRRVNNQGLSLRLRRKPSGRVLVYRRLDEWVVWDGVCGEWERSHVSWADAMRTAETVVRDHADPGWVRRCTTWTWNASS